MFENVDEVRLARLTDQEGRLLANSKRAYEDFVEDFIKGRHPKSFRQLLQGLDAAASVCALVDGQQLRVGINKKNFVALLASETREMPSVLIQHRLKGKTAKLSFPEMVYEVRCVMAHDYEDLDTDDPRVDNHVELAWDLREYFGRKGWSLPVRIMQDDKITLNAYALIEQLAGILAKVFCFVEAAQKQEAWKAVDQGIDKRKPEELPDEFWTFAPSYPSFLEILEKSG